MIPAEGLPAAPCSEQTWTRPEAIGRLRAALLKLCDDGRSMCQVAADEGIFCRGFRRWPEREFHERWKNLLGVSTHLTRRQMEELAEIWQLGEQLQHGVTLVCDAQTVYPGACRGWDEFSNVELARFCREILRREVTIDDKPLSAAAHQGRVGPVKSPRRRSTP